MEGRSRIQLSATGRRALLGMLLLQAACGRHPAPPTPAVSTPTKSVHRGDETPWWIGKTADFANFHSGTIFYGVGSGPDRAAAVADARAHLAGFLGTYVAAQDKYVADVLGPVKSPVTRQRPATDPLEHAVRAQLDNIEVIDSSKGADGTSFALASVDFDRFAGAVASARRSAAEGDLFTRFTAAFTGAKAADAAKPKTPPTKDTSTASRRVEPLSKLEFALQPGGEFHFGCEPGDTKCGPDEQPGMRVNPDSFWMGVTEVTVDAYARCIKAGACTWPKSHAWGTAKWSKHPVEGVDLFQAAAFCSWIGGRLPTAEEWEFAAKSGESRIYPWGSDKPDATRANYGSKGTVEAGSLTAGATKYGLLDMAGNVGEWTTIGEPRIDPQQRACNAVRGQIRGGSWLTDEATLRASGGHAAWPCAPEKASGFRCAL